MVPDDHLCEHAIVHGVSKCQNVTVVFENLKSALVEECGNISQQDKMHCSA